MSVDASASPLLESDLLRTFVAIADSGSFSRAAQQVHRTPAAVSLQIKRLEQQLGCRLFERDARRTRLTLDGERLLGYARRLVQLNAEALSAFARPALSGRVILGTADDVGTRVLPTVLSDFARAYPAVQVDVLVGRSLELRTAVDRGELDLALLTTSMQPAVGRDLIVHCEPLVWAACDAALAWQRRPLPVCLAAEGCPWRAQALHALSQAGIAYRIAYVSEHHAGQRAALLADLAVAPLPRSLVRRPLREVPSEAGLPPLGSYQVCLARRSGTNVMVDRLAEHVIAALEKL